jgi:hypothetical protein
MKKWQRTLFVSGPTLTYGSSSIFKVRVAIQKLKSVMKRKNAIDICNSVHLGNSFSQGSLLVFLD